MKNEDTRGHCCWPNQVWSGKRAACVGIPACPAPLVAEGETCRAAATSSAPPVAPAQPAPQLASEPPAAQPAPLPVQAQPVAPVQPAVPAAQPQPVAPPPPPVLLAPQPVPPAAQPVKPAAQPVLPAPQPVLPAAQPVYVPPNAVFVPVAPTPVTRTEYVRQPGKIVTGAFLLALAVAAIGSSVPLWQDAVDDRQTPANKHFSGQDGLYALGGVVLDAAGIVCGAVGGATLAKGIRGRAIEVPLAHRPEPVHGQVAQVEVALAF